MAFVTPNTVKRRRFWIKRISQISGDFGADSAKLADELREEIAYYGVPALLDHIRTCGTLPEDYNHDSSEEKLYSKYTDILLAEAFSFIGLRSHVVRERADAADVEAVGPDFSFVADAKAFRLSRTAKNQKDFKVDAMHSWKRAHRFAVVICPLYQLPSRSSQIYLQATTRDVLILSYSHLAVLIRSAEHLGARRPIELLHRIFQTIAEINPSKDAVTFWTSINRSFLNYDKSIAAIYKDERTALLESIKVAKEEGLYFLSAERKRIMEMSHEDTIVELIKTRNIDNRIDVIKRVGDNDLFKII